VLKRFGLKLKEQKGFTLIELLAVIVILGIIAAIAVPSISNLIQKSRIDGVKNDALQVLNSAKLYHSQSPEDAAISSSDLNPYLDNVGLDSYSVAVESDGTLKLTATEVAGSVTVTITSATYETLNTPAKWNVTSGATTLTVTQP
jgi:type IV pilus assembly protein PilA